MSTWTSVPFLEAFSDDSAGSKKLQQSEYQAAARFPVIDQGEKPIAGYTDDETYLSHTKLPVVVFGDHTRRFKFVDQPFVVGADGVKILAPKPEVDAKYGFHYLRSISLPSAGYSRHFKFLKDVIVPLPPLPEQRRIADILDRADDLRAKRRRALALADRLLESRFIADFESSETYPKRRLGDLLEAPLRNGISPAKSGSVVGEVLTLSAVTQGWFDSSAVKSSTFARVHDPAKLVRRDEFLICRGNGNKALVGRGVVVTVDMSDVAFPDTVIGARFKTNEILPSYLAAAWNRPEIRHQIENGANTTNGTFKINQQTLEGIEVRVPPVSRQRSYVDFVGAVESQIERSSQHLAKLDELFASLQHRAFSGQL